MLEHLADVSIRSLALAPIAAAVLVASRSKRTAALQHALWAAVVCGMLCLFLFGSFLPKLPLPILPVSSTPISLAQPVAIGHPESARQWVIGGTLKPPPILPAAAPRRTLDRSEIAVFAYAAIALACLLRFAIGMLLIRRLIARSISIETFRESASIAVPLTVGWFRPQILLPLEWREWDRSKLDAVLAHEGAHARRHDGLIAALAGINRCLFWFHPLAWWLERRLRLLAELACDESCVAIAGGRERYAALLLEMAQVVDAPHGRLTQHALTMASASHLRQRIDSILQEPRAFSRGMSRTAWTTIALCGIPVVLAAATLKFDGQAVLPPLPPPSQKFTAPAPPPPPPPPPRMLAQVQSPGTPRPAGRLQFEVASIRPATADGNDGGRCFLDKLTMDAGRIDIRCFSIQELIEYAYGLPQKQVGGPDWMRYNGGPRFDISAKLPLGATADQIPEMLQALLADRFSLALHRENKEQSVEALVIAKEGSRLIEIPPGVTGGAEAELSTRLDALNGMLARRTTEGRSSTRFGNFKETAIQRNHFRWDISNSTMQGVADVLADRLKRPVIDQTGLTGRYNVSFEWAHVSALNLPQDQGTVDMETMNAAIDSMLDGLRDVFRVELRKLGLDLEKRKAPVETIVVDRVEKAPKEN